MANTGYEQIISNIEQLIADARPSRFSGLVKIDAEKLREQLNLLRSKIPDEVMQARRIATDRKRIIESAKATADRSIEDATARASQIIADAEQKAAVMVDETSIVREAQARANQISAAAANDTAQIRSQAQAYKAEIEANAAQYYNETINKAIVESAHLRLNSANYGKQILNGFKDNLNQSMDYFSQLVAALDYSEQQIDAHITHFENELNNYSQYSTQTPEEDDPDGAQE